MAVSIGVETPLQDDVRAMVAELNAYLQPLTPRQFQFQMTVEQMADSRTTLFVARNEAGHAVGMGALKQESADLAEVKRMFTRQSIRGTGVGRLLLQAIEDLAVAKGIASLKLETGNAPGFEPAHRLYAKAGFSPCGSFLDYPESDFSAFFEKRLA
jgi:putative acetyltransferase